MRLMAANRLLNFPPDELESAIWVSNPNAPPLPSSAPLVYRGE